MADDTKIADMDREALEDESARLADQKVKIKRREAEINQALDAFRLLDSMDIPDEQMKVLSRAALLASRGDGSRQKGAKS